MEGMHSKEESEDIDLAGLMEKIKRRRNKKHRERRVRLKGKYFSTEGETTTKALIAKIEGKIRRKEDNESILSNIMENLPLAQQVDDEKPNRKSGAVAGRHEEEIPPRTGAARSVQLLVGHVAI